MLAEAADEVDGKIHRHAERQRAQHGQRHIEILAGEADHAVDEQDGEQQRHIANQRPSDRAEVKGKDDKHHGQSQRETQHHIAQHLVVPHQIEPGDARRFHGNGERMGLLIVCGGVNYLAHGFRIPCLDLYPNVRLLEGGIDHVIQVCGFGRHAEEK